MPDPAIVLVSAEHGEDLRSQFRRYEHEYVVLQAGSVAEAERVAEKHGEAGGQVALFVSDSQPVDMLGGAAIRHLLAGEHASPTCRTPRRTL